MNYLTLENVSKSHGDKVLFEDVNIQIGKGQKVAIVAKNGSGKSTLLRVIAGVETSDGATSSVYVHKGIRTGFLDQEPDFDPNHSVMEAVFSMDFPLVQAVRDYEFAMLRPNDTDALQVAMAKMEDLKAWDFEAKVKQILFKLGITQLDQPVRTLSGGQKKRLALAKLLIEEPEFIILDEPTNHLDLDMIEWLEEYLRQPSITLFMVTHDRYFLDRICDTIYELDRGIIHKYTGDYEDFLERKAARMENESVVLDKTKKLFKKELDWIRRMPKARTTKAKSRVGTFDDIKERAHQKIDRQEMQIDMKGSRLGSKILEAHYISKAFGDKKIVTDFHYKFRKNERVGIVGKNGAGKTTLIRLLTQDLRPDAGKVVVGGTVIFGHYSQAGMQLEKDRRVIEVIRDIADYIPLNGGQKLSAEQLLERFLFPRAQQQVFASQLSGGEKRRLYLLTVLMENPNFLILDEPTNDLDILTLNVLEDFLLDFQGCVLIVTHDRYFMDKVVDHLFIFEGDGAIRDYNGDYTSYRTWAKTQQIEAQRVQREARKEAEQTAKKSPAAEAKKLDYEQQKLVSKLERQIFKLEEQKSKISARFSEEELSPEQIVELSKEIGELDKAIAEKEEEWMGMID